MPYTFFWSATLQASAGRTQLSSFRYRGLDVRWSRVKSFATAYWVQTLLIADAVLLPATEGSGVQLILPDPLPAPQHGQEGNGRPTMSIKKLALGKDALARNDCAFVLVDLPGLAELYVETTWARTSFWRSLPPSIRALYLGEALDLSGLLSALEAGELPNLQHVGYRTPRARMHLMHALSKKSTNRNEAAMVAAIRAILAEQGGIMQEVGA